MKRLHCFPRDRATARDGEDQLVFELSLLAQNGPATLWVRPCPPPSAPKELRDKNAIAISKPRRAYLGREHRRRRDL